MSKVLHIVADGSPGGGTTNVLGLALDIAKQNKASDVGVVTQTGSYLAGASRDCGLYTRQVNFFGSRFDPRVGKAIRRIIEDFSPDILHLHGARASLQFSLWPRKGRRFAVIYTVHGYHFYEKNWFMRWLAIAAERRISSRSDATVFVCNYDRNVAMKYGIISEHQRNVVIYNGFDPESVKVDCSPKKGVVSVLGRLTYQKDPLLTVDVAAILVPMGYTFVLIGGGDMEAEVRAAVRLRGLDGGVRVLGSMPHRLALEELGKSEVMMLPSRWEGFPIAPIESMYNGIPVVAADVSGIPEIIEDEKTGLLVKNRDAAAYAVAIRKLCENRILYDRCVEEGKSFVCANFTRDINAKAFTQLYSQMRALV